MPLAALLSRLDKYLAKRRPKFRKNLLPGATAAELDALAKTIGKPLPADFRELLSWHNGQGDDYAGYFVDHWLLLSLAKITASKADLDQLGGEYGWNKNWLPFLDDDGGNFVVLNLTKKDPPVLIYWMGAKAETLAPSLEAWLTDFVTAAEQGKYCEDPERGTFTRSKVR
jgi:cell wall assembly regulator SMI1